MSSDIEVLRALPVLQKIWNTPTLSDYFKNTVSSLGQVNADPEREVMLNSIKKEAEHLYGKKTAQEVYEQIRTFPVVETGTHLAFLRDYDSPKKTDLRSRLNQNVLISSALMQSVGQKYHIGVYGSNVSLNHSCSGGYFQLGNEIFPVTLPRQISQVCLYDAPGITTKYFNEALPLVAKLKMLDGVLTPEVINDTQTPRKEMLMKTKRIVVSLLAPVDNGKANYDTVKKQYSSLNPTNLNFVKSAMIDFSADAYRKYGYTFSDVDQQYQELAAIFGQKDLKLPDQVALVQSKTINKALEGSDIKHISVDAVEVVRQFLISCLENKNSLWYKVFNNSENFKKMQKAFIGIRGSWKENESPFDYVARDKGFSKCVSLPLTEIDHKPETLLPLLRDKKIIPSSALMVLLFQSAGVMAHGGFFQTTYADKIKSRFVGYLHDIGEEERAGGLQKLPVDMALLSLAIQMDKSGQPMKLFEISRMSPEKKKDLIERIPEYPSCRAVTNALPVLRQYLDTTAPRYVQTEAANNNMPHLVCRHEQVSKTLSKIQEHHLYARSA